MRTRYLNDDGRPKYTNQLIHEQSPYLRQHAHNPVEWFPWGDAAFAKARAEDKPVFLSIGYSTCHWCHVMEDESFDDEEVAALLNEHFISIKLDREQRPDLDDIYMTGVQFISGQGGWPMSNFITPDGEPFYAGTYFPKEDFSKLILQLSDVWQNRRAEVVAQAKKITGSIDAYTSARSEAKEMPDELCKLASAELVPRLDEAHGGFGGAPKFPNESQLHALLASVRRFDDVAALDALTLSLNKMSEGGIYDQICGGFHRYTVDAEWLVPHFEKMLYNQAQLVSVYSLAYGRTKNPGYKRVVDETIAYLQRDMSDEYGAFYSATDADSEGAEGEFFVWQLDELKSLLSAEDFLLITELYQVSEAGNFEGANILNLNDSLEFFSATNNLPIESLLEIRARVHGVLYQHREQREHPMRDEKLITAWNGMMISALVDASVALDDQHYGDMATKAFNRIWGRAFDEQNGLSRICLDDQVSIKANLEDYAYLAEAALKLHRYSLESSYLVFAKTLVKQMLDLFWDSAGGFYNSALETDGPMISRARSPMDGAMPSANSAAMSALILLFQATNDIEIASKIDASIASFAGLISKAPSAFSYMCSVLDQYQNGSNQSIQLCADGQIQVRLLATENGTVVKIKMAEGWHINAATDAAAGEPINGFTLIATEVMSHSVARYPEAELFATGFQADDLRVYSGEVEILLEETIGTDTLVLKLQACSDQLCLSPDTLELAF